MSICVCVCDREREHTESERSVAVKYSVSLMRLTIIHLLKLYVSWRELNISHIISSHTLLPQAQQRVWLCLFSLVVSYHGIFSLFRSRSHKWRHFWIVHEVLWHRPLLDATALVRLRELQGLVGRLLSSGNNVGQTPSQTGIHLQ